MPTPKNYISLTDLEVYQLARELSRYGFDMYEDLHWETKKNMGDQFLTATDSIGANIAEGYARYHFRERLKFCYIARGSLAESSEHWLELLRERNRISEDTYSHYKSLARQLEIKLNNFISALHRSASQNR